ncbi:MAG: galactose oxidase-like domain-containing protein [Meiothermus sp.]|nr:galactose oxidase-like domain-containing protein [Meiothermus sp.]
MDAPSGLIASAVSPTQVRLQWTAPAGSVTGYALERRQGDGNFAAVGGSISASSVNFTDTVPPGGRSYTYRLKALNGSTSSSPVESNQVSVPSQCANGSTDIASRGCFGPVVENWPLVPTFSALLPNGRVIAWYASDEVGAYREDNAQAVHNQNPRAIPGLGTQDQSLVTVWNPAEGGATTAFQMTNLDQSGGKGTDLFCAGYTVLNDGRFLTAGGNIGATWGSIRLNLFTPGTNTWEKGPGPSTPNMWRDRWYPTLTKLPDGRVLISGGTSAKDATFTDGTSPTETALGDSSRTGQPICRTGGGNVCPPGLQGTVGGVAPAGAANLPPGGAGQVFATYRGIRGDGANTGYNNALEVYNPATGSLTMLPTTAREIPTFEHYYPQFHVAPNGLVYLAGAGRQRAFLNQNFSGGTPSTAWTNVQLTGGQRVYGSSVMYQPGRILVTGGGYAFGNNGTSSPVGGYGQTEDNHIPILITLNASSASISTGSGNNTMNFRRTHHNSTVLADGRVFINGGQQNGGEGAPRAAPAANLSWPNTVNEDTIWNLDLAVRTSEIWNPATQTFGLAALANQERMYHSVAMLLPDGTVLTAGGGGCGTCDNLPAAVFGPSLSGQPSSVRMSRINKRNSEIYYPPYLFKADGSLQERPVILETSIAESGGFPTVGYNAFFTLSFAHPEAGRSIGKVSLVALGAPTHAFNQNQRYLEPTVTSRNGNTLTISTTFTGSNFGGATASQNAAPPGFYMLFILDDQGVPSEAKIIRIQ